MRWTCPAREGAVVGHLLGERATGEVGEHEHDVVAVVDDIEERDDVRVPELLESGGFSADALARLVHLVGAAVQEQALAGHQAAAGGDRQVDDAHAPAAESALHQVLHGPAILRDERCGATAGPGGHGPSGSKILEMTSPKPTCHNPAPTMRWSTEVRSNPSGSDRSTSGFEGNRRL